MFRHLQEIPIYIRIKNEKTNSNDTYSRSYNISSHQNILLQAHQSSITVIKAIYYPFKGFITSDRLGIVKVWKFIS